MCLGLSLMTGGGDLITGAHSAGEVFSEYIPLGAFNFVNSLIFPSAREVMAVASGRFWPDQYLDLRSHTHFSCCINTP